MWDATKIDLITERTYVCGPYIRDTVYRSPGCVLRAAVEEVFLAVAVRDARRPESLEGR